MRLTRPSDRSIVGLDIEPGYLAAAEVEVNGRLTIGNAATADLPSNVVREGEIADPEALGEELKRFFREHSLNRRVRLGVANQRIVVRTLDVPPLDDRGQLAAAVRFQAQEHLPMPLEQAVIDFQPLGRVEVEQGARQRVLVVAARRDMIDRLLSVARSAGLKPQGIDLSAFAMIRALWPGKHVAKATSAAADNLSLPPDGTIAAPAVGGPMQSGEAVERLQAEDDSQAEDGPLADTASATLYISVGGVTNLAIAVGTQCLFTRVAPAGFESMAMSLSQRREISIDHSRQWLTYVGLTRDVDVLDGDQETIKQARAVLADGARRIADELRGSLEYHHGQVGSLPVQQAVLTGPMLAVEGFSEHLGAELGLPVQSGIVEIGASAPDGLTADGRLTIAAGLAVSEAVSA